MQIARVRETGREVAVKLYASRRAYEADAERSRDPTNPLHALMPRLRRLYPNKDVALRDVCGNPLPPFIVMDKAEPLDTYCSLHQPRRSEAFMVPPPPPRLCRPATLARLPFHPLPPSVAAPCLHSDSPHTLTATTVPPMVLDLYTHDNMRQHHCLRSAGSFETGPSRVLHVAAPACTLIGVPRIVLATVSRR